MSKSSPRSFPHDSIAQLRQEIEQIASHIKPATPDSEQFSLSLDPNNSSLEETEGLSGEALENAEQKNKIKRLLALIKYVEKYGVFFATEAQSIKENIKAIIASDPSFVAHEMKDQIAIAHQSLGSIEEDMIDANLTQRIISKTNTSLLNELIAAVPSDLSLEIINYILDLEQITSLQNRKEILPIAFDQRILSGLDFTPILQKLISKGLDSIQKDYSDNIASNERATSGSNSFKIAKIFFEAGYFDAFSTSYASILKSVIGRNPATSKGFLAQKKAMKNFADKEVRNILSSIEQNQETQADIEKITAILKGTVISGDDTELKSLLQQIQNIIPIIPNHAAILNSAIDEKLTKTFAILLEHGFDPSKKTEETINSLAYACKTQSSVAVRSYYESVARIVGQKEAVDLLQEIHNGKDALNHAIDGKSFLSTIQFILQKAHPRISNLHLISAAQKGHAVTFGELLKHCQLSAQDLMMLQNSIEQSCDFAIEGVFIDYLNTRKDSKEISRKAVASFKRKTQELEPQDIYRICLKSGPKAFDIFLSEMQRRGIEINFDEQDRESKTPLFYAIEENCFDPTVDRLLRLGANPNSIQSRNPNLPPQEQCLDALSLTIKHKESETMGMLLRNSSQYPKPLESVTIRNGLEMILGREINALLYSSFIRNIDEATLTEISPRLGKKIIQQALACELDSDLFAKIKSCCLARERVDLKEILSESIDNQDYSAVRQLIREFSPQEINDTFEETPEEQKASETSEATPLIKSNRPRNHYGSNTANVVEMKKRSQPKSSTHPKSAIDLAIYKAQRVETTERSEILKIVTLLYDSNFPSKEPDQLATKLTELGIDPDKTTRQERPSTSSVRSSICEQLMSCFNNIFRRA